MIQFLSKLSKKNVEKWESFKRDKERPKQAVLIACVAALVCVVFILFGFAVCCRAFNSSVIDSNTKHKNTDSLHLLESNSSSSQSSSISCDFEKLKLIEEIGRGKYGSVWKGILDEQTVSVKKFGPQNKQYFMNEKHIYLLSFMELSHCFPRFYGSQEIVSIDGRPEFHLVLSYAPLGCLQDYLRNNTIDWSTTCKMVQTTTQGLAYLHSEFKKGDKSKPCVAHRDLSSRNILVKADNSCMICDFQFAILITGSEYYSCGERFDSQTSSLNDVGTLRYMAPEILEGAVNLRDCESAMKQIDVYALGLVLWETASRCTDLYQGIEVPHYKQPFEKEIGLHPTFEQMQVLVTRHKARPLFPDIWKDSNPAIRALKETIEDCWDHDAEARLTALCVEERLLELPLLWERYKSGTLTNCVGTIYSMTNQSNIYNQKNALRIRNGNDNYHNLICGISSTGAVERSDKVPNERQNNRLINRLEYPNNNNLNEDCFVSISPSTDFEKNIVSAANSFINQPKLTLPLQPHQGRNPCLERNLMLESSDDNPSDLLEHGLKFQINNNLTNHDLIFGDIFNENISANNESNALVTNDLLNRNTNESTRNVTRRIGNGVTPIPFVQNPVGINTIPKQPNLPSNGQSAQNKKTNEVFNSRNNNESNFSKFLKWTPIKALKEWQNFKTFKAKHTLNDKELVEERQPFTPNNRGITAIDREEPQNIRPVSNSLISRSQQSQTSIDEDMSASTQPKVTQINLVNGSPLINIINTNNDKSNNKIISNQLNALIQHSIKTNTSTEMTSNLDRIEDSDEINSNTTESCDRLQTNIKESSVECNTY